MKPVLMIHEVREKFFSLPLENYILTFDDGLYSQYYFWKKFQSIKTEKIFFISSNILSSGVQSSEFPACNIAHNKVFETGNKEDYMTIEQVKELMLDPLVSIGGHSHNHLRPGNLSLSNIYNHIKHDTELMIEWFESNLGFRPTKFCFPYNNDLAGIYPMVLKKYGFTDFYGWNRIAVESLIS